MKVSQRITIIVAIIGYVSCQNINDIDFDDAKKKLEENFPGFDEDAFEKFNKTKLPNAEDVENVLREKCKKNGAENAVDELHEQQEHVKTCVESYINVTVVQAELEEAKKTGSMDEVFAKYCKKWPEIYACFHNVTTLARACMDDNEKTAFNKSLDILHDLQTFMCFKDGDRLAMFVAEGGVGCLTERKEGVQNCFNSTLGSRIPDPEKFSVATLPTFLFSAQDCTDFDKIRSCVSTELEKCKDSTPANIIDAFFKFLKKHMPCDGVEAAEYGGSGKGGSWLITSSTLLVVAALVLSKIY